MRIVIGLMAMTLAFSSGCATHPTAEPRSAMPTPGTQAYQRAGDEIVVAGQLFHTGTPVVLWMDPGGYDAYRVERRFVPYDQASWEASAEKLNWPNRYGLRRRDNWPAETLEQIRGGGWDLPLLQDVVDQFVIHYDASGTSRHCFNILHDHRGLSAHFLLDLDGTIYQTLDLKERAWHASVANDRSVGIEIANIGAYTPGRDEPLQRWYGTDETGQPYITIPEAHGDGGIRTPDFVGRPARSEPIYGSINGRDLKQYDLTPEQYEALIKLTAALWEIFPNMADDVPRDDAGEMIFDRPLTADELATFRGLLGHHHVTSGKVDPGPAFQWDHVLNEARKHHRDR
ncbi:N-acetylmuramoyl-L-alanine amidase [Phycisphaerales bacterium AB-hyl4]|uniref:N-acetylmuramoyl-L-alanine amidase n=1 Tax=Natronomicrosphaera hydrolytica TaxID=3242702 RepID=A0ABV4U9D4_9BACT